MDEFGDPPDNIGVKEHDELATYLLAREKYAVHVSRKNVMDLIVARKDRSEVFFPTKPYVELSVALSSTEWPYGKSGSQSKEIKLESEIKVESGSDKVCSYESVMSLGSYWVRKMERKSNSSKYAKAHSILEMMPRPGEEQQLPTPEEVEKKLNIQILNDIAVTMDYIAVTPPEYISVDQFKFPKYLRSLPMTKAIFNKALDMFDPEGRHNALRHGSIPFSNVKADCSTILYIMRMYIFFSGCDELKIEGLDALDAYRIPHYLNYLTARQTLLSPINNQKTEECKQQPEDEKEYVYVQKGAMEELRKKLDECNVLMNAVFQMDKKVDDATKTTATGNAGDEDVGNTGKPHDPMEAGGGVGRECAPSSAQSNNRKRQHDIITSSPDPYKKNLRSATKP